MTSRPTDRRRLSSLRAMVRYYIAHIRPVSRGQLDCFRKQPSLKSAVERAAQAVNCTNKRYSHQRRIKRRALEDARRILPANLGAIRRAKSFADLIDLLDDLLRPVPGLGELYIYDAALRIGAKRELLPAHVYLHAGTRVGARALGFPGTGKYLSRNDLPSALRLLKPYEVEDLLCIFKAQLRGTKERMEVGELIKRSWCG